MCYKKEKFEYYLERKKAYEQNLKNGYGHKESILKLIEEIDNHLLKINPNNK